MTRKPTIFWPLLLLLLGCQQPFGSDRHQLQGFRVFALTASPRGGLPGDLMVPTAYMAHEDRVWSDTPTKLHWFWIEDNAPDSVFHLEPEEAIANGPHPYLVIPSRNVQLALLAVNAQGVRRHATLQFPFERVGEILPSEIEIFQVDKTLSSLTGPEMTLQERTQWETQPATFVQEGESVDLWHKLQTIQ